MPKPDPKAPQLIETLQWLRVHGLRNWKYVLVAAMVLIAGGLIQYYFFTSKSATSEVAERRNEWPDLRGCKSESPDGDPPLLVKFADGSEAYVNYRQTVQMNPSRTERAAKIYRTPFDAYVGILEATKSSVYGTLEQNSEAFARANRAELAAKTIEATRSAQEKTAFDVLSLEFLSFCSPSPRGTPEDNPDRKVSGK